MNNPFNDKDFLTEREKKQLKFSQDDKRMVFEKISKLEDHREAPPKIKKTMAYILTPVAIGLIALLAVVQTPLKDELTSAVPSLGSISSKYGSEELKEAVKDHSPQIINQSSESQGIKITIKEVLYDGPRLSFFYEIEDKNKKYGNIEPYFTFTANGEDLANKHYLRDDIGAMKTDSSLPENLEFTTVEFKQKMPEKFSLGVNLKSVNTSSNGSSKEVMGKWSFSFPVEKKGTEHRYTPNLTVKQQSELTIRDIVFSPTGVHMSTMLSYGKEKDNLNTNTMYQLFDDKGNPYEMKTYGHKDYKRKGGKTDEYEYHVFKPAEAVPNSVTVRAKTYYNAEPNKQTTEKITAKLPLYLEQDSDGGITVLKVEKKQGEVWVHFEVKGNTPDLRKHHFNLVSTKDGKMDESVDYESLENTDKERTHIAKFKTAYKEDLLFFVSPPPEIIEEFEVNVPLKKEYLEKR